MTLAASAFPLSGVIGIVDASIEQLELAQQSKLQCVEVRADLLRTAGLTDSELMSLVSAVKRAGLACLFTLRHADQGGTFNAAESERVSLCKQALDSGADIIDLEHGTESSSAMLKAGAPVILSYHNFNSMLDAAELAALTDAMELQAPAAIKIIPTGSSMADAASMLSWVGNAKEKVRRIGFSMGSAGGVSRILTLAHGAPVTYASFGEPVAPGQVDIALLLNRYHCNSMNKSTEIVAVVGDTARVEAHLAVQLQSKENRNCVWIGIESDDHGNLIQLQQAMKVSDIVVL